MPYLKLIDSATHQVSEIRDTSARLGRSPECRLVCTGPQADVVSALHAELGWSEGEWSLRDLESRNGTYLNGRRIDAPVRLAVGDVIGLGESGPRLSVVAVTEGLAATLPERPGLPLPGPELGRAYAMTLLDAGTGHRYEARGARIRIGRGHECDVRVGGASDAIVSRVHAELVVDATGGLGVRDAGSRNGTFVNGERVTTLLPVRLGDRIMLGSGGPVLIVEGLGTAPQLPVARPAAKGAAGPEGSSGLAGAGGAVRSGGESGVPGGSRREPGYGTVLGVISQAFARAKLERRRGQRGSTAFLKAVAAEVRADSRRRFRWLTGVVMVSALLLGGAVYGVYWLLSTEVEATDEARRSAEDSSRAATERLARALDAARASAAPASQVESLRTELEAARARTAALGAALDRAQTALTAQLAAGEQRRVAAQSEVERLRDELTNAERRAPSPATVDSLRRAVASAEQQTQTLDAKMRAIRGTDFASIAQQNQGAVGLLTVSFGRDYYNGTGFTITPDGYMLTNWHVVADSTHPRADTIWVIMADQSTPHYADVIATSEERDIAVIKIRSYQGPAITSIDWHGTRARQGEPAALIGYPAGSGFARLRTAVIHTSMSAGIISRTTDDVIQFDGMTIGGSSGSPLFNANGEVIAIHRAGLPQAPGFALSVPVRHAIAIMPIPLRQRLGLE